MLAGFATTTRKPPGSWRGRLRHCRVAEQGRHVGARPKRLRSGYEPHRIDTRQLAASPPDQSEAGLNRNPTTPSCDPESSSKLRRIEPGQCPRAYQSQWGATLTGFDSHWSLQRVPLVLPSGTKFRQPPAKPLDALPRSAKAPSRHPLAHGDPVPNSATCPH